MADSERLALFDDVAGSMLTIERTDEVGLASDDVLAEGDGRSGMFGTMVGAKVNEFVDRVVIVAEAIGSATIAMRATSEIE